MIARIGRRIARGASATLDAVHTPAGITVLAYHRVGGGTASAIDLDVTAFTRQLETLREDHRVITLDEAVDELTGGATTPSERAVVVTIDDGTADLTDVVVPLLVEYAVPATVYVATKFVDEQIDFPWGPAPTSWQALRDAVSTGVLRVGSHTHTHPEMHDLDATTAADELDRSIGLIEDELGVSPAHFAYPRAVVPSAAAESEVRRRFRSAALAGNRVNTVGSTDPLRLGRTPVQTDDAARFPRLARGGGAVDGALRATILSVTHRRRT